MGYLHALIYFERGCTRVYGTNDFRVCNLTAGYDAIPGYNSETPNSEWFRWQDVEHGDRSYTYQEAHKLSSSTYCVVQKLDECSQIEHIVDKCIIRAYSWEHALRLVTVEYKSQNALGKLVKFSFINYRKIQIEKSLRHWSGHSLS